MFLVIDWEKQQISKTRKTPEDHELDCTKTLVYVSGRQPTQYRKKGEWYGIEDYQPPPPPFSFNALKDILRTAFWAKNGPVKTIPAVDPKTRLWRDLQLDIYDLRNVLQLAKDRLPCPVPHINRLVVCATIGDLYQLLIRGEK